MDAASISAPDKWRWQNARTGRYYEARITRGLWGDWHVQRVWGALGTRFGGECCDAVAHYHEALDVVDRVAKRRAQRGYQLT